MTRDPRPVDDWNGQIVRPGEARDVRLAIGESYSGLTVEIPIHVSRAVREGPVVFVTAALHGDEINGTGAVRQLIQDETVRPVRGTVVFVPVLNMLAFERHSRYLPDRRDLNRSFPGTTGGSLASRMARIIFDEIVARCDYGIDLHTAAVRRTNYPNVRADLSNAGARHLAEAFACELIVDGKGPQGSLRREACRAGCPTIIMEGGEVWKVEPGIVESATRGVKNALRTLGMLDGAPKAPPHQVVVEGTTWVRAQKGGFLQFHVRPGDIVEHGQPLASNTTLLGKEQSVLEAPFAGVVIGMTTLPAISPGEPVCHMGRLPKDTDPARLLRSRSTDGLQERLAVELASNVLVVERTSSSGSTRPLEGRRPARNSGEGSDR